MIGDVSSDYFIQLNAYHGAYGPTLRVDVPTRELLDKLKDLFENVAQKRTLNIDLTKVSFVRPGNVVGLSLNTSETDPGPRSKSLLREQTGQFSWMNSSRGWEHCVDLLNGFRDEPAHQYLTTEGIDDALIKVAFMEK